MSSSSFCIKQTVIWIFTREIYLRPRIQIECSIDSPYFYLAAVATVLMCLISNSNRISWHLIASIYNRYLICLMQSLLSLMVLLLWHRVHFIDLLQLIFFIRLQSFNFILLDLNKFIL